ncbi:MAG: Lar family restriction alleviation protein [Oscillospiraceae bacterium]|nr:Lar family restriction alleviation protein [Oscillospiraceae bacterium]
MSEITEKDLKPCPYCDYDMAIHPRICWFIHELKQISPDSIQVYCLGCGARGGTAWSEEEAIKKWNRRNNP